jgi:hypothetical protein
LIAIDRGEIRKAISLDYAFGEFRNQLRVQLNFRPGYPER